MRNEARAMMKRKLGAKPNRTRRFATLVLGQNVGVLDNGLDPATLMHID
jgi:hypothetical protein